MKVYEKRGTALNPVDQFHDISNSSKNNVAQNQQNVKTQHKKNVKTQYSLAPVEAVQPTSDKWSSGATTDEVRAAHPTLYAVDEAATEKKNPT